MTWVRQPSNLVILSVKDINGKISTQEYWVPQSDDDPAAGGPAELADAVQGLTNGAVVAVELQSSAVQDATITPGTGPYDSVRDKLKLEWLCQDGSTVVLQLPSPKQACLNDDNYTVDYDSTEINDLWLALAAGGGTNAEGAGILSISNGYRRMPPGLKR